MKQSNIAVNRAESLVRIPDWLFDFREILIELDVQGALNALTTNEIQIALKPPFGEINVVYDEGNAFMVYDGQNNIGNGATVQEVVTVIQELLFKKVVEQAQAAAKIAGLEVKVTLVENEPTYPPTRPEEES